MAYLEPHFEPDVFVSYSHGDPGGLGDSPLKEWTRDLVARLEKSIRALEPEFANLCLWHDEGLDRTAHLTEELRGKVGASGVLMIIMSAPYLLSRWCKDELEWFGPAIQDRAGGPRRVFIVHAQPTDQDKWPAVLRDDRGHRIPGFALYDPATKYPWRWLGAPCNSDAYFKEFGHLQTALTSRLRELRDRAEKHALAAAAAPPARPPGGPRRVYLHAQAECEQARADIGRILAGDGIVALSAPPVASPNIVGFQGDAAARLERARRCEALALLRDGDDERFVWDFLDIADDERRRMEVARGAPMPCAVLDRTGANLPVELTPYTDVTHFDITRGEWRGQFRQWLDASGGPVAARL